MPGGSFVGALISGFLSDILGRKYSIMIGSSIWIVGSIISCASQNIGMLVAGRFINGLAVGICSAQVPVYVSELAPPRIRGFVVGLQQWAITWGILIMYYISFGCSYIDGVASFRIPWGLQMLPGLILGFGMFFLPRSPRWLARKDRWDESLEVLAMVHGKGDKDHPLVRAEFKDIQDMVQFERENTDDNYRELFRPRMIKRTFIACTVQMWSQLTGMNVMMYYITYVFLMAGITGNANLISSSIQYVINVVMTLPGLWALDHVGRRPLLIGGSTFMMIWLFANAGLMATYGVPAPPGGIDNTPEASWQVTGSASKAVIACTYLFVASFAPTWGPASWVYVPEIFPLRVRGKGVALATSTNWIFNFALGYFVPPAFENIQWRTYLIFGVFCFAMTVQAFFMYPETANKGLEEIEEIFLTNVPAWKTSKGSNMEKKMSEYQQARLSTAADTLADDSSGSKKIEQQEDV